MNANNKSVEKDVQEFELDTGVELTSCVVLLVALSSLPLACTTTTTSTTTTKTTPPEDAGVAGEEPGGATASPVDDSEEAPDSGSSKISCGDSETKTVCDQCCLSLNPAGQQFYHATSVEIVCRDASCKAACSATYCASPPSNADATCKECWNSVLPRHAKEFFDTCLADDDCAVYSACLDDARCSDKPK